MNSCPNALPTHLGQLNVRVSLPQSLTLPDVEGVQADQIAWALGLHVRPQRAPAGALLPS